MINDENNLENFGCSCTDKYFGVFCQFTKYSVEVLMEQIERGTYLSAYAFHPDSHAVDYSKLTMTMSRQKLKIFQESATIYINDEIQILIVETQQQFYLAVLKADYRQKYISTNITSAQHCPSFKTIARSQLTRSPEIRRVKYYHQLCRLQPHLLCFVDDSYLCLCTMDRQANCLVFEPQFNCQENLDCQNGAQCLQDNSECPANIFCVCSDCFYGDRCQFYAKGIGLTLDDILRYELRPSTSLHQQSAAVKVTAALSIVLFVVGLINSVLSLMTFRSPQTRQVGAGMYLFASSITSLVTISLLNTKGWFLLITNIRSSSPRSVLRVGCIGLEPILKIFLYTDSWLNACVAIERALAVHKEHAFNKSTSKRWARWMIGLLPVMVSMSLSHEFVYRDLSDDHEEQRVWCVFSYSKSMIIYSTFILLFHNIGPFMAHVCSALFIIFRSARRKARLGQQQRYIDHLRQQVREHRHLIVGPIILAALSVPRVIISLIADCVKASRSSWLYLFGYFISFIPAVLVFTVFVFPSPLYRREFSKATRVLRNRISRMNIFSTKR